MSINKLFKQCGYSRTRIFLPDVPQQQRALFPATTRRLIDLYHLSKRAPITRQLLYLLGPLLYAVAEPGPRNGVGRN